MTTLCGERRDGPPARGASSCFLGRHFAGGDTIEHPDPGGEVVSVSRVKGQDAQIQTATLVFVVTFGAVLVEEFSRFFRQSVAGERNTAQHCCRDEAEPCTAG